MDEGDDELLTLTVVAERTGYTSRALRELTRKGTLPAKKYGKTWLVRPVDLRHFLAGHHPTTGRPRGSKNRPPAPPA